MSYKINTKELNSNIISSIFGLIISLFFLFSLIAIIIKVINEYYYLKDFEIFFPGFVLAMLMLVPFGLLTIGVVVGITNIFHIFLYNQSITLTENKISFVGKNSTKDIIFEDIKEVEFIKFNSGEKPSHGQLIRVVLHLINNRKISIPKKCLNDFTELTEDLLQYMNRKNIPVKYSNKIM